MHISTMIKDGLKVIGTVDVREGITEPGFVELIVDDMKGQQTTTIMDLEETEAVMLNLKLAVQHGRKRLERSLK